MYLLLKKKIFLEDSRYYVEEIRKNTIKQLGYDKVYKEGLNIKTPLNLELQKLATISLREGIEKYDRRKGWRGPIQNIDLSIKEWSDKIKLKKLEKTLDWKIARVTKIGISNFEIITSDGDLGFITNENIKWTGKKNTSFKEGDIIYVKKKDGSNEYILKQLPNANGAIVVMDPYNGRVLALSGGFSSVSYTHLTLPTKA